MYVLNRAAMTGISTKITAFTIGDRCKNSPSTPFDQIATYHDHLDTWLEPVGYNNPVSNVKQFNYIPISLIFQN